MDIAYVILFFILGACFGSFANVVIYRWPKEESFIKPRSKCPSCSAPIKSYQNIPIISWLFLKGKCAQCKNKISIMYPMVEALTGLIFALIFLTSGLSVVSLNMMVFTIFAVPCFFIDLKHMYLPDVMTLPGLACALIISFFNTTPTYIESFFGALLGGGMLWLLAYAYKKWRGIEGMGGGDIKLLAWLGALLGYQSVTFVLFISSIVGTLVGSYFLIFKGKDSKTFAIPFGPFLILAGYFFYFVTFYSGTLV
jgi:leader peptidase (prepilin peptidase) / N-methyltransferase